MGIDGHFAYRYKRKYYIQDIKGSAEPECHEDLARRVPRDAGKREAWIQEKIKMLEQVVPVPSNEGVCHPWDKNLDGDSAGFEVLDSPDWLRECEGDWVYVIDFDNYVFSIGFKRSYTHIKLDNMLPDDPGLGGYFDEEGAEFEIPDEHLTMDVDLWPDTGLDATEVRQKYNDLQAVIVSPSEWGAPTWETLSISQQLSVCVLEPFVYNSAYTVGPAYFSRNWDNIEKFYYRVISIAAPSDIVCPPQAEAYHALYFSRKSVTPEEYRKNREKPDRRWFSPMLEDALRWHLLRPLRFRGCLIAPCSRLDEPVSLMHEVERVAEILRKSTHTRVGILISRWKIVAVAIHGSKVYHSPALDFNNCDGELCDGILLMMHLLSPLFTTPKTPWSDLPPHKPSTPMRLPLEIIEYIIHLADFETYLNLRSLSRTIRDLCLARPQVGKYTILGKIPGRDNVFKVRHRNSSSSMDATFTQLDIEGHPYVPCVGGIWVMIGDGEEPEGSDSDWE
ncbi:CHD5 domain containing protein [Ceratobasidium theobromae]|uniref:CHD5 domain containing protein n=1 Tax=Ceratobasidium theobromae TaxID=1582974 RepID=A0A5N5QQ71_9AGAM|nr:CHD5 domain containing protein [Ceratobasidium theobromae]